MTAISMSETDYATLVEAAAWVRFHSGIDAPEYPALDRLIRTVDAIASRRPALHEAAGPREPRARCSDLVAQLFDLRDRQARGAQQLE